MNTATGGSDAPLSDSTALRLLQAEAVDMVHRARLGGVFYVIGWALAVGFDGLASRAPGVAWGTGGGFLVLALLRVLHRMPVPASADPARELARSWAVVLATAVLWGAASGWVAAQPEAPSAGFVVAIGSVAFSTAMAHTFCMRPALAACAIAMLYLPALAQFAWAPEGRGMAAPLGLYLAYVALALLRSHREYRDRLALEEALRCERDRFEQQSRRDALTGLANRRRFTAVLAEQARATADGGPGFALLICDLDHFKQMNDLHGHSVGDACLVAFAGRLTSQFGAAGDLAARIGGEEFAVLLPRAGRVEALARAEALRATLAATPLLSELPDRVVTVSIGVAAVASGADCDPDTLYRAADDALYAAKAAGRNAVRLAPEQGGS